MERQLQNKNNEKEEVSAPEATVENPEQDNEDEKSTENIKQPEEASMEKSVDGPESQGAEKIVLGPESQKAEKSVVAPPDSKESSRKRRGKTMQNFTTDK